MNYKASFELHHNFPKLAEESGFSFNTHKPRSHIEWSKIKMIDIDNLIRDRKFTMLEQHINDILNCVLESEFDVRILDEGVLKIFRLSQLAVEYQQFCRNYLDRSVYVLREEVTTILKELEITKRSLKEKEEEIKRLKRKPKHSTPLTYGNENIATMLLNTLNNNKGNIFSSTANTDILQYNKCSFCEKVFLNQLYLKSHISRRHPNYQEIPQKDTIEENTVNDNAKLNGEVEELKLKLKQMEDLIKNNQSQKDQVNDQKTIEKRTIPILQNNNTKIPKETKDAEVSTDKDENLNDKIDQWKKEEYEKYNREIILLRQQITDIVNNKDRPDQAPVKDELKIMEQLEATIKQQGSEILALKKEILKGESQEKERQKDIEIQISYWLKQAEVQSNEYKVLLQKLNDVANEARECRSQAEAEKEKSTKLQEMLHLHLSRTSIKENIASAKRDKVNDKTEEVKKTNYVPSPKTTHIAATEDLITLSKLQQKAQELLNLNETSTGESSNASEENYKTKKKAKNETIKDKSQKNNNDTQSMMKSYDVIDIVKNNKHNSDKKHKPKSNPTKKNLRKENGYVHVPSSPMKVIRAKLTEEVNNRLTLLGVDPLKNRLPRPFFQKQRMLLQKEQEIKAKKFPKREKIFHSILANLEQNISNKPTFFKTDNMSPNKLPKTFSFSTVLTNVKTKALSLVKSHESSNKSNKPYNEVAKKAMALLQTPPGSAHSSPTLQRQRDVISSSDKVVKKVKKSKIRVKRQPSKLSTPSKKNATFRAKDTSDDENSNPVDHEQISNAIDNLVKSPVRQPTIISESQNQSSRFLIVNDKGKESTNDSKEETINIENKFFSENNQDSSDGIESINSSPRKFSSNENIHILKQTKGVLKNASSTSSLNKKKVLFDMDAIQMKSVSASPSQSITEKGGNNERNTFSIDNLDTEEWDISSIENEPVKSAVKIQFTSHTSPKIAELKQSIESQLTRRNPTLSTALVGGVDVLTTPIQKASFGGSNTSLGSSILDDTDNTPLKNKMKLIKPKGIEKDDSEIEISDLINETVDSKNYLKSY